jgi:hypothetical protein
MSDIELTYQPYGNETLKSSGCISVPVSGPRGKGYARVFFREYQKGTFHFELSDRASSYSSEPPRFSSRGRRKKFPRDQIKVALGDTFQLRT